MTAYYQVTRRADSSVRIMEVDGIRDQKDAEIVRVRIEATHADEAKLISLQDHRLSYTKREVMNERNLLGPVRRYSTGERTVTIPE